MTKHETDYKDWILNLIRTCLPLELRIKILTMQPLSKEEIRKYANVVALVSQVKTLMQIESLADRLEKNTERIIRTIKSEGVKNTDARTPQQRALIDSAVKLYVRRKYVDQVDIKLSLCISNIWNRQQCPTAFRNLASFNNAVRYDMNHYYSLESLVVQANASET